MGKVNAIQNFLPQRKHVTTIILFSISVKQYLCLQKNVKILLNISGTLSQIRTDQLAFAEQYHPHWSSGPWIGLEYE